SLAAEREWYATQRREYGLVRDAWLSAGVACLMIKSAGSYPSFPHTSDNIDVLVRPEHGPAARDVLRRLGYVELRNVEEPQKHLFRAFHGGRCVSAIHVHERVAWFVGFFDDDALWARRRRASDDPLVDVPAPEDTILINLAHACYENKLLRLSEVARLRHALRDCAGALDWAYMERVAASRGWLDGLAFMLRLYADLEAALFDAPLLPAAVVERCADALRRVDFAARRLAALRAAPAVDLPLDLSYSFCKRLYYRKILADPARARRERWCDVGLTLLWGLKLKSGLRPQPGMVVALSGPDGSGKTAHAEALVAALRLCEIKADYVWTRGGSTGLAALAGRVWRRLAAPPRPGPLGTRRGGDAEISSDCRVAVSPRPCVPASAAPGGDAAPPADHLARRRRRLGHPLVRFLWAWLVAADQVGTHTLRAGLPALLGRVVVADRYAYDAAVEMDASLPPEARWSRLAIAALLRLMPRPHLAYVLDVAPEAARARKPDEVWHADLEAERHAYRALAERFGLRVLSTAVVMAYMADFETWLNALFLGNPGQKNVPDPAWARGGAPWRGA
ncbi:MAG: nucleotidyltransferase family protein, partial [Chloroflexi bacterium]|nr:nucleotidyltransferase family protein [Chloroflexota bacterium]